MLPIHTILFPTDFSENAERAFPLACALARDCGARIVVLYVMPLPVGDEQFQARHHPDDYFAGAWEALHQVRTRTRMFAWSIAWKKETPPSGYLNWPMRSRPA